MRIKNFKTYKGLLYLITGGIVAFALSNCDVTVQRDDDVYMVNENDDDEIKNRKLKNNASENTYSFYLKDYHISKDVINLNDIAPNTREISFINCQIESVDFISSLKNLNKVMFEECKIENLSAISSLENLNIIAFMNCEVENEQFENICDMGNLNSLIFHINDDFDYTLFSRINDNLEELTIRDYSTIKETFDFSNISNLRNLKRLTLKTETKVNNIDLIENLTQLNTLIISEYNYENLEFIKHIPNLEYLYLTISMHDLENGLVDISPISELNDKPQNDNKLIFKAYVVVEDNKFIEYSFDELQELINNNTKQLKRN